MLPSPNELNTDYASSATQEASQRETADVRRADWRRGRLRHLAVVGKGIDRSALSVTIAACKYAISDLKGKAMQKFNQGDTVRTRGGGPTMTVDAYTPSGEVICTYWVKGDRRQGAFVEATLEVVAPEQKPKAGVFWLGKDRR